MVHPPLGPGRPLREWIAQCRSLGRQPWLAIPADTQQDFTLDSVLFPVEVDPDTNPDDLKQALVADGYELFISPGELLDVVSSFDGGVPKPAPPEAVRLRIAQNGGEAVDIRVPSAELPGWWPRDLTPGSTLTVEVLDEDTR